jgi:putative transposase
MSNYKRVFEQNYSYFITVVTHQRNPILINHIDLLRDSFKEAKQCYVFNIEAIVILPDHFHMIISPERVQTYPYIIKTLKQYFSMHCPAEAYQHIQQSASRIKKGYKPIWQKRYYEHTLRDEEEYRQRFDYIHYKPVKHGLVEKTISWRHSSFHKYVKKGWYSEDWADFSTEHNYE